MFDFEPQISNWADKPDNHFGTDRGSNFYQHQVSRDCIYLPKTNYTITAMAAWGESTVQLIDVSYKILS